MVEKGQKYGFLVIVLGQSKYGTAICNPTVNWITPKDPGGYEKTIQEKDSSFERSKKEKKHAGQVIKYNKFLGRKKVYGL